MQTLKQLDLRINKNNSFASTIQCETDIYKSETCSEFYIEQTVLSAARVVRVWCVACVCVVRVFMIEVSLSCQFQQWLIVVRDLAKTYSIFNICPHNHRDFCTFGHPNNANSILYDFRLGQQPIRGALYKKTTLFLKSLMCIYNRNSHIATADCHKE